MIKKNRKVFLLIISLLIVVEIASVFLAWNSFNNKPQIKDEIKNNSKTSILAIMLEQSDGTYEKSESNGWPSSSNYSYNGVASKCLDVDGNEISGILSFNSATNEAIVETTEATKCYLYFDIKSEASEKCTEGSNLGECLTINKDPSDDLSDTLEGGLYRYQGTNPDNYICFGTSSKEECVSNTDAYMYRIMGINSNNQLKLIKKEALNSAMAWYSDSSIDIKWPESTIYSSINGALFLNTTTYVPSGWEEKIADTEWKYGDVNNNEYLDYTASELYEIENSWTDKTEPTKIGLMYAHDYYYGISGGGNCKKDGSDYPNCKTSWLHLNNNDTEAPNVNYEWTMSRSGVLSNAYYAWSVHSLGYTDYNILSRAYSVRPVFYLDQDEVYVSGSGTIDDPYIIGVANSEEKTTVGDAVKDLVPTGLNTTIEGGLYRFQGATADNYICFGTSSKEECVSNTDAYMYRIMGINESGQLKLIKKEALNEGMAWNSANNLDINWPDSNPKLDLNGDSFLNNTLYVPDETWKGKISVTTWKYGDEHGDKIDLNYTALELYNIENSWTRTSPSKIALMYAHDYYYGMVGGNNCSSKGNISSCKTSWINLSNNDTGAPDENELTMSRYGNSDYVIGYHLWYIYSYGYAYSSSIALERSVRPVFFLNEDVEFNGGTGTSGDPFLIK